MERIRKSITYYMRRIRKSITNTHLLRPFTGVDISQLQAVPGTPKLLVSLESSRWHSTVSRHALISRHTEMAAFPLLTAERMLSSVKARTVSEKVAFTIN